MAANFDLTNLAVTGLAPGNELIYDNAGMPSIMVKIPKMTYKQLGMGESAAVHPAFIVNGQEVDAIYISKYQNIVQDGRAYSLGGVDPAASLDMDHARQYCEAKGEGWHLMTRMEWGLIQRMCEAAGFVPKGNNNYGRHDSESFYKAIPTYMSGGKMIGRVATGTGPLTWYHDNSPSGISGLTGNVWEWMGAVRSVYGEIQFLVNNNGADSAHSQSPTSTEWKAISCVDGSFITPDGKGTTANSVKIDIVSGKLQWAKTITHKNADGDWPSCTFGSITCSADIYKIDFFCIGVFCRFSVKSTEKQIFKLFSVILTRVRKEVYRMEGKQDELFTGPTLQKIEDMMEYAYPVLQQFPKSEKFAMAADMKLVMDVMLEKAVEAQKKYFKKTTLQELDVANTKLQHYLRVAFRLRFISMHKYEVWSKQLVEIGKLLGSWLNTVKANSKT